jgi:diamine N-acetyltransferase
MSGVSLRPLEARDLERLARWRNDPRVHPFFFSNERINPEGQANWFEAVRRDPSRRFFVVESGGEPAGAISLDRIDRRNKAAELGNMLIDPERRRGGLGRLAVLRLLELAFSQEGLERIELRVFPDNQAAVALYEGCGFRREGIERAAVLKDGRRRDVLRMGILKEEVPNVP